MDLTSPILSNHFNRLKVFQGRLGKGRTAKERLSLPDPTQDALSNWLRFRGYRPGPLFIRLDRAGSRKDLKRMDPASINYVLQKYSKKIGQRVKPHGLRHAAITEALEVTNGDVRSVARFSRHRDLRVLTVYDDNRQDLGGAVANLLAERVRVGGNDQSSNAKKSDAK